MIEPHCQMTAENVAEHDVVLCVGDTTFLDYGSIEAKKGAMRFCEVLKIRVLNQVFRGAIAVK